MPKTILRQFTGGISNEIDAQNLREDQGEEAVDINLKGFALEPGEGLDPLTDAGHYYYRGEWIKDSEAVSFEESGVGVVKTYDTKRPQFEEIINDKDKFPAFCTSLILTGPVPENFTIPICVNDAIRMKKKILGFAVNQQPNILFTTSDINKQ